MRRICGGGSHRARPGNTVDRRRPPSPAPPAGGAAARAHQRPGLCSSAHPARRSRRPAYPPVTLKQTNREAETDNLSKVRPGRFRASSTSKSVHRGAPVEGSSIPAPPSSWRPGGHNTLNGHRGSGLRPLLQPRREQVIRAIAAARRLQLQVARRDGRASGRSAGAGDAKRLESDPNKTGSWAGRSRTMVPARRSSRN